MSSDHQRALSEFSTTDEIEHDEEDQPPVANWTPTSDSGSSKECQNCGAFVDKQTARVFGGNDGEMHGCFECMDRGAVREGGAVDGGPER